MLAVVVVAEAIGSALLRKDAGVMPLQPEPLAAAAAGTALIRTTLTWRNGDAEIMLRRADGRSHQ